MKEIGANKLTSG